MATKVCLLIRSAAAADHGGSAKWIRDLEEMLEVRRVYRVLGQYDLLVELEPSASALQVANKILVSGCVEHLVVSFQPIGPALRSGPPQARSL